MKIFKLILGEIGTLIVALVAIAIIYPWFWIGPIPGSILVPGILYALLRPLYVLSSQPFKIRLRGVGIWVLHFLYQLWVIFRYICLTIGYVIDLLGCVAIGDFIRFCVTKEHDTLFGRGDITISAALGDLLRRGKLNDLGIWICWVLSCLDPKHKNHCIAAIELYEYKKSQK
jgi:hypothetical protein